MDRVNDEEAFFNRVQSFQTEKWFAKPDKLSPVVCASRGWTNQEVNRLVCLSCKAQLTFPYPNDWLEDESNVETFLRSLEWEHDAECVWCEEQCPEEFLSLTSKSSRRLQMEVLVRFQRLNTLWDIPKMEIPGWSDNLQQLEEFLLEKLLNQVEVTVESEEWKQRHRVLTFLALCGWELLVLDHKVGLDKDEAVSTLISTMHPVLSESPNKPEETGYCFARQSILYCKQCNAVFGLWSFQSEAFISFDIFQTFIKEYIATLNFNIIDDETGEVEDLFHKPCFAESKNLDKLSEPHDESELHTSTSFEESNTGPVFGINRLKRRKSEIPSLQDKNLDFLEKTVNSELTFEPITGHRSFCLYRQEWKKMVTCLGELPMKLERYFITAFRSHYPAKCGISTCLRPSVALCPQAAALPPPKRPQDGQNTSGFASRINKRSSLEKKKVGASASNVEARQATLRRPQQRKEPIHAVHGIAIERPQEAVLYRLFQAHESAVTAVMVVLDDEGHQKIVTSSLDKSVAYWSLSQIGLHKSRLESTRVSSDSPVLAMTGDSDRAKEGVISVFCGRAKQNDILCWDHPPNTGFNPRMVLTGQSGWIRDLESYGRWMFSVDCNHIRQWDLSFAMPRHVKDIALFKGDILSIACGGNRVFAGVSDGTIHSWKILKTGELVYCNYCKAHDNRVTALAWNSGILYSSGSDGNLKSWRDSTLDPIGVYNNAHGGKRINCLDIGPDGVLYSGGEDSGQIRRWTGPRLFPCQQPLLCHRAPVRALNFGTLNSLVSGDAKGVVSVWKV